MGACRPTSISDSLLTVPVTGGLGRTQQIQYASPNPSTAPFFPNPLQSRDSLSVLPNRPWVRTVPTLKAWQTEQFHPRGVPDCLTGRRQVSLIFRTGEGSPHFWDRRDQSKVASTDLTTCFASTASAEADQVSTQGFCSA